ncbi:MAG: hypothetical protein IPQ07_42175 [Myxococcales bacterium]|nr:hypothetical protein [Myxococcales bacterium]
MRLAIVLCVAAACGKSSESAHQAPQKDDAAVAKAVPARIDLPAQPLGLPSVEDYQWRKRAGQTAFKTARKAESRGDWAAVEAACTEALRADPGHLDAAWLLAAALGEQGKVAELERPLSLAVAGDFGKWGAAALELPQLRAFLATPIGLGWKRRAEEDRARYLEALSRATIVAGDGELYAFDPKLARWHRLTRTGGAVVGALAPAGERVIAYVTRQGPKGKRELAIGTIDLGKGRTARTLPLGTLGPITVAYSAKAPSGFYVGSGAPRPSWRLVGNPKLEPLPPKTTRPPGRRLEVQGRSARLHALPVPTVIADWDEQGLASAMRIGSSNKVVTVPSPGLIDGNTVTWSPDHSHLAFIAQLQPEATCTPGTARAAAYTADAATGVVQPLLIPTIQPAKIDTGLSVEWMTDRTLVVASGDGVTIAGLDGGERTLLPGATELLTPRPRPRCTPAPDDDPADDPEPPEAAQIGTDGVDGGGSGSTMVGPP